MTDTAKPPVRVLLIAPAMHIMGGQAVQGSRLLEEIGKDPYVEIDFLTIGPPLTGVLSIFRNIRFLRTILTFLRYLPGVLWRVPQYEIIHVFSAAYWSYLLWSLPPVAVGKLFNRKTILNYRTGEAEDHLSSSPAAVTTLRWADVIVSPSDYVVDVFKKFDLKVRWIPNIIDPEKFVWRKRSKLRPVFLHNRGLEPLYNVGCALRAFRIIQDKYPNASLTIAHDGISRAELEAYAAELKLRNTQFIGRVPHAKMANLYDSVDVYLTCPNLDCMPGSLLECYASGLPLVATKAGGIPYMVRDGETGLLVDLDDHEGMAKAALRLLEDKDLVEQLTRHGREELHRYSAEVVAGQWVALYRELVRR